MSEPRKDKRSPTDFAVRLKSASIGDFVDCAARDISLGGLFVRSDEPMDPGTLLRIEFHVEDGAPLCHGVGRVVWARPKGQASEARPAGMGVKFVRMDTASKRLLSEFIKARGDSGGFLDQGPEARDPAHDTSPKRKSTVPPRPSVPKLGALSAMVGSTPLPGLEPEPRSMESAAAEPSAAEPSAAEPSAAEPSAAVSSAAEPSAAVSGAAESGAAGDDGPAPNREVAPATPATPPAASRVPDPEVVPTAALSPAPIAPRVGSSTEVVAPAEELDPTVVDASPTDDSPAVDASPTDASPAVEASLVDASLVDAGPAEPTPAEPTPAEPTPAELARATTGAAPRTPQPERPPRAAPPKSAKAKRKKKGKSKKERKQEARAKRTAKRESAPAVVHGAESPISDPEATPKPAAQRVNDPKPASTPKAREKTPRVLPTVEPQRRGLFVPLLIIFVVLCAITAAVVLSDRGSDDDRDEPTEQSR